MSRAKRALLSLIMTFTAALLTVAIGFGILWLVKIFIPILTIPLVVAYILLFFFAIFYMGAE